MCAQTVTLKTNIGVEKG